jgi:KDO2-lipid IV(A) lauroyltransferase|tara:strand:- start:183 stop:1112 length:930 start_codon:yes stop_codon:yes gene_type:complete
MSYKKTPPAFDKSLLWPQHWPSWFLVGLLKVIALMPLAFSLCLGRGLGLLLYRCAGQRRAIAEVNIALCFPQLNSSEQAAVVKESIISVGITFFEAGAALWGQADKFKGRHIIEGLEHIEKAQAEGRGALLLGAHFTTIDVAGRIVAYYQRVDTVYRKHKNPVMAYQVTKARDQFGDSILRSDMGKLVKTLRRGNLAWYAPDQDYGAKHSVFAPFFGQQAATVTGSARIAKVSRAALLPFSHYRDERGHYRVVIKPALENFPSGDDIADATLVNQHIEAAIAECPEQYLWVHRRFKTRPEGEQRPYKKS